MYPKFIIAGNQLTGKGTLRMGMVVNHKDLRIGFEKVWGGGWWERDDTARTVILSGCSCDFGPADFRHLNRIDSEFREYTFFFAPIAGLPGNVLDLSDVEWI